MKKIVNAIVLGLLIVGFSTCQKTKDEINQKTEFDINYSTDVNVPSSSITVTTVPLDITTPEVPTNATSNFSANKTTVDLVSEIKLTKLNISTSGADLNFLKSLSIYIKASGVNGEVLVAEKNNIPAGITSVSADLKDVNIKDYISKDKVQFRVSFLFQTGSSSNQNLKLDQTVRVKATLLK